jgi:hypothetical protein
VVLSSQPNAVAPLAERHPDARRQRGPDLRGDHHRADDDRGRVQEQPDRRDEHAQQRHRVVRPPARVQTTGLRSDLLGDDGVVLLAPLDEPFFELGEVRGRRRLGVGDDRERVVEAGLPEIREHRVDGLCGERELDDDRVVVTAGFLGHDVVDPFVGEDAEHAVAVTLRDQGVNEPHPVDRRLSDG